MLFRTPRSRPQFYAILAKVFRQSVADRARDVENGAQIHELLTLGRNLACPCGSGLNYKKCCLGLAGARYLDAQTCHWSVPSALLSLSTFAANWFRA
ncbi:MAG: SEC-C domain-containing protein [Bryobacterales bacterium]|nr:SEC-C domain-containing protein [Bryobacterales bacterium]